MKWTIEKPFQEGIYLLRHKGVPQYIQGMRLKRGGDCPILMKVNGCTITPFTEGYTPMPDSCLTYSDFLETGNWQDFEFYGPLDV